MTENVQATFESVDQFVSHWAKEDPNRMAIICERSHSEITYGELESLINVLSHDLSQYIAPGDTCAIFLDDSIVCHAMLHAIFRIGAISMPLDSWLGELTRENVLRHTDWPHVLVATDNAVIEHVKSICGDKVTGFDTDLATYRDRLKDAEPFDCAAQIDNVAMIAYTSGTTSDPKGVVLTHRNLIAAYTSATNHMHVPRVVGCVFRMATLGTLGIHFFYGQYSGATTVILPKLTVMNAGQFWSLYEKHDIDFIYLVPSLIKLLLHVSKPAVAKPNGVIVSAGSHLLPAHQEAFQDKFNVPVINVYGLTESSFGVFFGRIENGRGTNDIGPACSLVARVVDDEGNDVPQGETGELWYKGEMVAREYFRNEAATASTFKEGGWLATGDLVQQDKDGNFTITGRKKDIIIRGGFNVYPFEIQEAIQLEDSVLNAVVMGKTSDVMSESIVAYVQIKPGYAYSETEIAERVKTRVGTFRAPDTYHFSEQEIPLNRNGKVDVQALQALYEPQLEDAAG